MAESIRRNLLRTHGQFRTGSSRRAWSVPTKISGRLRQSRRLSSSLKEHFAHVLYIALVFAASFSYERPFACGQRSITRCDVFESFHFLTYWADCSLATPRYVPETFEPVDHTRVRFLATLDPTLLQIGSSIGMKSKISSTASISVAVIRPPPACQESRFAMSCPL